MANPSKIIFFLLIHGFSVLNANVIDFRKSCTSNVTKTLYLPSGEGEIHSFVIYLTTNVKSECKFNIFSVLEDVGLIVVLEFSTKVNCKPGEIVVKDDTETDVCGNISNQNIFRHQNVRKNISLAFNFTGANNSNGVKVIVTAATALSSEIFSCVAVGKISCIVNNKTFCLDKNVQCDGHTNCGMKGKFDENEKKCKGAESKIWLTVIFTFLVVVYSVYIFYRLLNKYITSPQSHFFLVNDPTDDEEENSSCTRIKISVVQDNKIHETLWNEDPLSSSINQSSPNESSSSSRQYYSSSESSSKERNFKNTRQNKSQPFGQSKLPILEKRFTGKTNKLIASTSEETEPKITFYSTRTKFNQ